MMWFIFLFININTITDRKSIHLRTYDYDFSDRLITSIKRDTCNDDH